MKKKKKDRGVDIYRSDPPPPTQGGGVGDVSPIGSTSPTGKGGEICTAGFTLELIIVGSRRLGTNKNKPIRYRTFAYFR